MTPARALSLGLVFTATAGFVDAVGFLALGGYYTSFMSGITTQLGTALASGDPSLLALPTGLVILFFIGSYAGTLASQSSARRGSAGAMAVVLLGVAASLAMYFADLPPPQSMLALAFSAGAQNAVLPPKGAARLGATFVTGTLFAAGQDLARATIGVAPPWRWLQHLLVWASLCVGALVGAYAYVHIGMGGLLIPAAIYIALFAWFSVRAPLA